MSIRILCDCLSTLDRRDGRRCQHDSWGQRQPNPATQSWQSPRRDLPLPVVYLALLALFVAVGFAYTALRPALCDLHEGQLAYCADLPGYSDPHSKEPRP